MLRRKNDKLFDYVDERVEIAKSKNVILVPYKLCEAGYGVAVEPIIQTKGRQVICCAAVLPELLQENADGIRGRHIGLSHLSRRPLQQY